MDSQLLYQPHDISAPAVTHIGPAEVLANGCVLPWAARRRGSRSLTFCLPSMLVFSKRMMNWKFDLSPLTSDMLGNVILRGRCSGFSSMSGEVADNSAFWDFGGLKIWWSTQN